MAKLQSESSRQRAGGCKVANSNPCPSHYHHARTYTKGSYFCGTVFDQDYKKERDHNEFRLVVQQIKQLPLSEL